jgi:O-succinylbenzoate synthase
VFNDEYKKLSEIVDPSAEITNFKIYPVDKNAIIEGNILNNRAQFKMELSEDEVKVDTGTIGLNDDNNEILKKLQGYFKNWKNEWAKKITTEFNQRTN